MLKESADRFIANEAGFQHARASNGFAPANWRTMAELGWLQLLIPEASGGLGGGAVDAALLTESFGRGLVVTPYISTAAIAVDLLSRADDAKAYAALLEKLGAGEAFVALATEEPSSRYDLSRITSIAKPNAGGFALSGVKIVVQDGAIADHFLVSALLDGKIALWLVNKDAAGLTLRPYRTLDHAPACDLSFDDTPATLVFADAAEPLERAIDQARVLLAAEALGCMEGALTLTAEYIKTRKQFGRTLSSFQALTHRIADCYVKCEQLRSALFRALSLADENPRARAASASAALITAIEAGEFVCGQAIQLHGGIGMTQEYSVGHYYKRVRAIGRTYGDLAFLRRRYINLTQRDV